MSDANLPPSLMDLFDGNDLDAKTGVSAMLCTVDGDGWPHASFLSAGEVLIADASTIMLMLWPASTTAGNVTRSGRAALFAAADGIVWELRLDATSDGATSIGPQAFRTKVVSVRHHRAPYADVAGMISFDLHEPQDAVARWRRQIGAMRDAAI